MSGKERRASPRGVRTARELARALDALFLEQSPRPKRAEREIWMYAGKRELARALIAARAARGRHCGADHAFG